MGFNRDKSRVWPLHSITPLPLAPWVEPPSPGQLPEPLDCLLCHHPSTYSVFSAATTGTFGNRRQRTSFLWSDPAVAHTGAGRKPQSLPWLCDSLCSFITHPPFPALLWPHWPPSAPSLTMHTPDLDLCHRYALTLDYSHPRGGHGSSLPPSILPGGPRLPFHSATAPSISQA